MELIKLPIFWGCLVPATMAGIHDLKTYLLPDYLTVLILVAGLIHGAYMDNLGVALAGAGTGFFIGLASALLGQMGMGDAKLMAGLGAWLGPYSLLDVIFLASILGALWGFAKLAQAGKLSPPWKWRFRRLDGHRPVKDQPGVVAFGACLAAGLWFMQLTGFSLFYLV